MNVFNPCDNTEFVSVKAEMFLTSPRRIEHFIFYLMKYLYHRTHKHSLFIQYYTSMDIFTIQSII